MSYYAVHVTNGPAEICEKFFKRKREFNTAAQPTVNVFFSKPLNPYLCEK